MLSYFTTWNIILLTTNIKKSNSRALITLCGCVSLAGLSMLRCEVKAGERRKWKRTKVNCYTYLALELVIHQLPLILMLRAKKTGNALGSLVPALAYSCVVNNPYTICGKKIKNYHGIVLALCMSLIVNECTGFKHSRSNYGFGPIIASLKVLKP